MSGALGAEALLFFEKAPGALPLCQALSDWVLSTWPDARVKVQKTQIGFYGPGLFVCASLAAVRPRALRPDPYLTVTFSLACPLDDPRALCVPVRPGRFTHHVLIGRAEDLDAQLKEWIVQSHALAGLHRAANSTKGTVSTKCSKCKT